jgi:hypothetical protein
MGLSEVPCELLLFRMKKLWLFSNNLCSLPSEIALLATLEELAVRLSKRLDHDLTKAMLFQVNSNQLKSLPPELGLLTNLKWLNVRHSRLINLGLTRVVLSGRRQPAHVAPSGNRPAATARAARSANFELMERDLTSHVCALGLQQPAQMVAGRAGPVAEARAPLCATLGSSRSRS